MTEHDAGSSLLCRIGAHLCALPLRHVLETLRPLPVEPLAGAPAHVLGIALIRGVAQPVVDAARLLGDESTSAEVTRYVTMLVGHRRVALAVSHVLGTRSLPASELQALPPLMRQAGREAVAALGELDAELLLVLDSARLLPPESADAAQEEAAA